MEQEHPIIPVDDKIIEFRNILSYSDRVLFSAQFGDGKTWFLDKFKEEADEYLFLTIYPVNYQVEENKDVFELIKRDILFQLSAMNLITDEIDVNALVKSTFNKDTIKEMVNFLADIAELAIPGANLVKKLVGKFIDIKDSYDKEKETTNTYLNKYKSLPGIYEFDCYTELITKAIEDYKNNSKKKVVLIIEDMDRIDPAHLFRILNIFTAHIDRKYISFDDREIHPNKFGFDKIVTVCCYENIQNIFNHFYGDKSAFTGYIDKFASHNIFHYSINQIAQEHVLKYIQKECKIDLTNINFELVFDQENPLEKIRSLSVRKCLSLITDISSQIRFKLLFNENGVEVDSIIPLTKFYVILKRLNSHDKSLILESIFKSSIENFVNLLDIFWLYQFSDEILRGEIRLKVAQDENVSFRINVKTNATTQADYLNITHIETSNYVGYSLDINKCVSKANQFALENVI